MRNNATSSVEVQAKTSRKKL